MKEDQKRAEIELRGTVLIISIAFEGTLMSIIYASNVEQYIKPYHKRLILKNCTFFHKIERTKDVLNLYHRDLLNKYQQLFYDLDEFKTFRNLMAHCGFSWDKEKPNEFDVWDYTVDEDGFQYNMPIRYDLTQATQLAISHSNKILAPLTELRNEIELRLKENYPQVYEKLKPEYKPPEAS